MIYSREFIPQIEPWIDGNELHHLKRVIDSTYIVEHNLTKEFELNIKNYTGSQHALAMTNGTMCLFSCLKSYGFEPGDEIIVPNLTFVATSNAVIMAGLKPIFCDIEEDTLCIDPSKIEELITPKTKAIIPVHLYGNSAKIYDIIDISKKYNLKVIEDAAQGIGVFYFDKHVGTIGDCGILSFYGNKLISTGEGGVILSDNEELIKSCYRLKNHGRDGKGIFIHEHVGFNFSFTEMQAAIGISQMEKLNLILNKKKMIHDRYQDELKSVGDIKFQQFLTGVRPAHWFTSFFTDKKTELSEYLYLKGIQTRDFFYPLHLQPCYKYMNITKEYPVSNKAYQMGISLPSSYNLTEKQQEYIISNIKRFYGK